MIIFLLIAQSPGETFCNFYSKGEFLLLHFFVNCYIQWRMCCDPFLFVTYFIQGRVFISLMKLFHLHTHTLKCRRCMHQRLVSSLITVVVVYGTEMTMSSVKFPDDFYNYYFSFFFFKIVMIFTRIHLPLHHGSFYLRYFFEKSNLPILLQATECILDIHSSKMITINNNNSMGQRC